MKLTGQTVAVVGGGSGVGKAVAGLAVDAGAEIVLSSRDSAKLQAAVSELGADAALAVDMTDAGSISAWTEALPPIDHLVISA